MFIVLLKFSKNRGKASQLIGAHNEWIKKGFEDGVFLLVGSLKPGLGGAVVAHNISREEIERRIQTDPFVAEDVVSAEVLEIDPARATKPLEFLMGNSRG